MKAKFVNEENSELTKRTEYKKAYQLTLSLIDGNLRNLRYTSIYIPGIIDTFKNYGLEINDNTITGFKDAVIEFLEEEFGVEQTFVDEKAYDFWQNLSADTYKNPPLNIFEDL